MMDAVETYTTADQVSKYLQRELTDDETTALTLILPTVDSWIDKVFNSHFNEVEESSKYFEGGSRYIDIQPCTEITEVMAVNDDLSDSYDYTSNTEYIAYPLSETVKNELAKVGGCFPSGGQRIKVTAKFSEYVDQVPSDIQHIATVIAATVLNQGKNASSAGNIASESLEGHSVTYDTSDNTIEGISLQNPVLRSLIDQRREIMLG